MAGKGKKRAKPKTKGAANQAGKPDAQSDEATDAAILRHVIEESKVYAESAALATLEESVLSGAIEASIESSNKASQASAEKQSSIEDEEAVDEAQFGIENCQHIKDAVKLSSFRKSVPKLKDWDQCQGCLDDQVRIKNRAQGLSKTLQAMDLNDMQDNAKEGLSAEALWMCMSCYQINCGRAFKKHAMAHHDRDILDHPLAINLANLDCWCYECDDQLMTSKDKNPIAQQCKSVLSNALLAKQFKMREASVAQAKKMKGAVVNPMATKAKILAPGLQNLGNTCFFNSVMQVLAGTRSLKTILSDNEHSELPISLSARTENGLGPLTTTFKNVLFTMWKQEGGIVTPRDLFTQIAKKWKLFRGFKEQDSQELMRHLFDGIRLEEVHLIKKRIAEEDGTLASASEAAVAEGDGACDAPPKYVPFIDSCFSGMLVSVIVCQACKKCSYSYEDYFDLSLPVKVPSEPVGGSLMDQLRAKSRAAGFDLSMDPGDDKYAISEADQGTAVHLKHVEKLLKNIPSQTRPGALSIERSLSQFTSVDCLEKENKFACENCYKLVKSYGISPEEDAASGKSSLKSKSPSTRQTDMEGVDDESKTGPESEEDGSKESTSDPDSDRELVRESKGTPSEFKSKSETDQAAAEPKHILRKAYKRYLISSLPPTLVLHLKRFEQSTSRFGLMRKIEDQVDIPIEIDMAPYCIPKSELIDEEAEGLDHDEKVKALAVAESQESEKVSEKYRLYGATVHQGSLATGHYTNYVLSSRIELPQPAVKTEKISSTAPPAPAPNGNDMTDMSLEALQAQMSSKKGKKVSYTKKSSAAPATAPVPAAVSEEAKQTGKEVVPVGEENDSKRQEDLRQWIQCSDTNVRLATLQEVLASRPYLLYYERC